MNQFRSKSRRRLGRAIIVAVIAGAGAVGVAEQVIVKQDVDVKADKNPLADAVESVSADSKLEVLGKEGGWVRVRTSSGKEGYLSQDDLPSNTNASGLTGNSAAGSAEAAAAGRGLEADAEKYASAKNLNRGGLNQVIALGKSVSNKELREFAQAGHVGPAKFRK